MNIMLCDDNLLHLEHAAARTRKFFAREDADIRCCRTAEEVRSLVSGGTFVPHITIVDIELDGCSGIYLARELHQRFPNCQIIFLSAYSDHASDVYRVPHVWFVLKSHMDEFLPQALERAAALHHTAQPRYIIARQKHITRRLPLEEIYYLERRAHQTRIVAADESFLVWQTPSELLQTLPENAMIRCHQSYWVNPAKIAAYVDCSFHLLDGTVIPISRTYKKSAWELFHQSVVPNV